MHKEYTMPDTPVQDTEATLPLHINELTEGTVDGSGVFDVLMQAVKAHLRVEFDAGRIRATDYANVYTMSVGQVLAESTQYAVVKAKLDAELALVAAQTNQVIQETKTSAQQELLIAAQTSHTTKQELQTVQETMNLLSQDLQIKAQTKGIESQTALTDFQLTDVLPVELANLTKQGLQLTAQTELTNKQVEGITTDNAIKDFQLSEVMPAELANLNLSGLALSAQTEQTTQQTSNLVTQNLQVLEQTKGIIAETSIKEYQLTSILPVELANLTTTGLGIVAQTANVTQQTENLLSQMTLAETQHILDMQAIEVQIGKTAADTVLVTKQCLLTEAQAVTESAQSTQLTAQTRQTDYVTTFQIPAQIAATEAQSELATAQEAQVTQQTLNTVAERDQIVAQSADIKANTGIKLIDKDLKIYERDFAQPINLELLGKEVLIKESQVALGNKELIVKQAQVDLANKDIALKQNQIDLGTKELLIKEAQISVAEKEILLKAEQLLIAKYELATKLPADVALTTSQADLYNQKKVTELAQVDSAPIKVGSVIDYNNKLIDEQGKSFLRSAQANSAKLLIDTWNVRHTADPDGNYADETNKLDDATIKKAVTALLQGINIPVV